MDAMEKEINEIIAAIIEMDKDELWKNRDKHFFEELKLDSLLALEIIASVEKKYRIEIHEDRLQDLSTLESAIALVRGLCAERAADQTALPEKPAETERAAVVSS